MIHLGAVQKDDQHVGSIEMRSGEDSVLGLVAEGLNFGLGDEIVGPDYVHLLALGAPTIDIGGEIHFVWESLGYGVLGSGRKRRDKSA